MIVNHSLISDFKNSYLTASLEYTKPDYNNPIFLKKSTIELTLATGKRDNNQSETIAKKSNQFYKGIVASGFPATVGDNWLGELTQEKRNTK